MLLTITYLRRRSKFMHIFGSCICILESHMPHTTVATHNMNGIKYLNKKNEKKNASTPQYNPYTQSGGNPLSNTRKHRAVRTGRQPSTAKRETSVIYTQMNCEFINAAQATHLHTRHFPSRPYGLQMNLSTAMGF